MTRKHTNIELVSNSGFFTLVAYSLKDKYELLSKAKKKKPRKLSVCVAFASILYVIIGNYLWG